MTPKLILTKSWMGYLFNQKFFQNSLVIFSDLLLFAPKDSNSTNFLPCFEDISAKNRGKFKQFVKLQSPEEKSSKFERSEKFVKKI